MHPKLNSRALFVALSLFAVEACATGGGTIAVPSTLPADVASIEVIPPPTRSSSRAVAGAPSGPIPPDGAVRTTDGPSASRCSDGGVRIEAMSDVEPYLRRRAELFLQHCPGASFTIDHNEGPHDLDSLCAGLVDAAGLTARPSSVGAGSCPEDGMRLVEIALDAGPAHDDEVAPGTQAEAPGPGSSPRRLFLFVAERSSTDGALVGAFVDYLQGSERFDLASRAD